MFDKMKQMYELQKKAKEVQRKLEAMRVERAEGGVKLAVNGIFKVETLEIDPSFLTPDRKAQLESTLKKLFSDAIHEAQKRSAAESQDLLKGFSL